MDYQVWYLTSDSDKFHGYMKIPLTKAGKISTACVEWLVNSVHIAYLFHHHHHQQQQQQQHPRLMFV